MLFRSEEERRGVERRGVRRGEEGGQGSSRRQRGQRGRRGRGVFFFRCQRKPQLLHQEEEEEGKGQSEPSQTGRALTAGGHAALCQSEQVEREAEQREALHVCSRRGHRRVCYLLVPHLSPSPRGAGFRNLVGNTEIEASIIFIEIGRAHV